MSQASCIRLSRVFCCLAEVIQCIQSRRAIVVVSCHVALASGDAARASRRSDGTSGSGSGSTGAISSVTMSPASTSAASRSFLSTLSQWLNRPSGSSVARKGRPLMVPSTVVLPRLGSLSLAALGRTRKVQERSFPGLAGRSSLVSNRNVATDFAIPEFPLRLAPQAQRPGLQEARIASGARRPDPLRRMARPHGDISCRPPFFTRTGARGLHDARPL
ncbi:MAG: hypothetical protein HONDAALG_00943 [Gammaproteobacteria bacterium]|nr:hypothetical protein [Gammaproteobacteria bacterium]